MRCIGAAGAVGLEHAYDERGVELTCLVPAARSDALATCLRDATRGAVALERIGEAVIRRADEDTR